MDKKYISKYNPSKEVLDYKVEILNDFDIANEAKQQSYPELDNMSPMTYMDESRMRNYGYFYNQAPNKYEEQGPNVFFQKTNNKINIISAFSSAQRPRAEISTRVRNSTKSDKRIATISLNAYDYFMEKENADEIYLDWKKETLITGTGFLYEYYDYQEREVKNVIDKDYKTGKLKYKTSIRVVSDQPKSKIVPFEQLFFPTLYETDIQNYPYVIYREYLLRSIAEQVYGKFGNWKYVPFVSQFTDENTGEQFYYHRWKDRVTDPFVEILHRFKKVPDTHDILINGVLMTEIGNPMIYDHKEYPFIPQYVEKIKGFILGRSLPMKICYAQDTFNELMNANISRSRSSSHLSLLSSLESDIEYDSVGNNEIIKTNDENGLRELKINSVQSGDISIMSLVGDEIDEDTAPKTMDGSISGETATAIMNAVRQSTQNLGPQLIYQFSAVRKHSELRLKNIFQFFFNANLKGEAFEMKEMNIEDVKLQDGQKGIRIIRIVDNKDKIPSKKERDAELRKGIVETIDKNGKKINKIETNYDIVYITPDDIADIDAKIKLVSGSSLPDIKSLKKAMLLELINAGAAPALQQYPDF